MSSMMSKVFIFTPLYHMLGGAHTGTCYTYASEEEVRRNQNLRYLLRLWGLVDIAD